MIIFKTKTIADTLLKEICCTPFGGVLLWAVYEKPFFWYQTLNEDGTPPAEIDEGPNVVQYITSQDGRVALSPPLSESDLGWLTAYWDDEIKSGDVIISDELPSDWQYPEE